MSETKALSPYYRRVYVWEMPVRLYHWINALSILLLGVTGFLIGRPLSLAYMPEASQQYWFGAVRFTHFLAGYVFLLNFLVRIYWGFAGNKYAAWNQFIPTKRKQFREMLDVLRVDVMQTQLRGTISIGHNMLAGTIYFLSFWVFLFQAVSGFGLYAATSHALPARLSAWIVPFLGGDMSTRQWHHAGLWFYVVFSLIHVYLVFYHDYVEGRGTTSSMVGGWKFERDDQLH